MSSNSERLDSFRHALEQAKKDCDLNDKALKRGFVENLKASFEDVPTWIGNEVDEARGLCDGLNGLINNNIISLTVEQITRIHDIEMEVEAVDDEINRAVFGAFGLTFEDDGPNYLLNILDAALQLQAVYDRMYRLRMELIEICERV